MSEWQPIETAPKDGTPVLLRYPMQGNDIQISVPWVSIPCVIGWWKYGGWEICFAEEGAADTEGYSSWFNMTIWEFKPTGWKPLPA